ncbi:4'-phosphopantetheinyl transferase superfamily protein [bacterium]|nr:4'-phosphopantetheinyl transferase superfamily protein [bacterium]
MPLYSKKQINNGIVALWKINESFEELLEIVPSHWLENIDLKRLSIHNLAARALANVVCPDFEILEKDEFGKPYFESAIHKISITHAGDYAGFMLKEHEDCGIDMEKLTDRIFRIQSKFIREDEESFAIQGKIGLFMVWCAKETMYKYYGMKALDFKKHLKLIPQDINSDTGKILGIIEKGDYYKELEMEYESFDNYLMVNTL